MRKSRVGFIGRCRQLDRSRARRPGCFKVRALTRIASSENEADLLNIGLHGTAQHVEKFVRLYRRAKRAEETAQADAQHENRGLTFWHEDDGTVVLHGRFPPEMGARILSALDAAMAAHAEEQPAAGWDDEGAAPEDVPRGTSMQEQRMTADHLIGIERFEADLWKVADNLRANSNLASNEYFMPILGLIFLRHATNRYYAAVSAIEADKAAGTMPDRPLVEAEFTRRRALMLPEPARYDVLLAMPKDGNLGAAVTAAMEAVEDHFPPLAGQLPKDYERFEDDVLEEMMRTFDAQALRTASGDVFGRIYEYFLAEFSKQGAHDNGEFFTPPSIVQTIVNVIEPDHGLVLDPACGSGGMFVQSSHFIEDAGEDTMKRVTFYGHEKNETTAKLAGRVVDTAVGELEARDSDRWPNAEIGKARRSLEGARASAVEALRRARHFVHQPDWLQERFPDARLRDVEGLVKLVERGEIEAHDWSLTPGRYVGVAPEEEEEDFDFAEAMRSIHVDLDELNEEAVELAARIARNFEELGV